MTGKDEEKQETTSQVDELQQFEEELTANPNIDSIVAEEVDESEEAEQETPVSEDQATPEKEEPKAKEKESEEEAPSTYKFGDREFTAQELAEDHKLLTQIITNAEQSPHFQKLHREDKKTIEDIQAKLLAIETVQQQTVAAQTQAGERLSPEQMRVNAEHVKTAYLPQLEELAKAGVIEEDAVTMFPGFLSQVMHQLTQLGQVGGTMQQRQEAMWKWAETVNQHATQAQHVDLFDQQLEAITETGGAPMQELKHPERKQQFKKWLIESDNAFKSIDLAGMTGERLQGHLTDAYWVFLRSQGAFEKPAEIKPTLVKNVSAPADSVLATGGGTGGRGSMEQRGELEDFEKAFNDLANSR